MPGRTADGLIASVRVAPEGVQVSNPGFDVTPARLVTSLVTERGVVAANSVAIATLLDPG
jgi:methylthioribose-1-phosphate isomerase